MVVAVAAGSVTHCWHARHVHAAVVAHPALRAIAMTATYNIAMNLSIMVAIPRRTHLRYACDVPPLVTCCRRLPNRLAEGWTSAATLVIQLVAL